MVEVGEEEGKLKIAEVAKSLAKHHPCCTNFKGDDLEKTLHDQLKRQLDFIRKSNIAYDDGDDDEAIRIAIAIRVLLHETTRSHSLLAQMNARNCVHLLSTVGRAPLTTGGCYDGISTLGGGSRRLLNPKLARHTHHELVQVDSWWGQVVIARGGLQITRKMIVLMATNKDGGAHVDEDIGDEGKLLREGGFWTDGVFRGRTVDLGDIHLVALRQFGFEILHSQELVKLVPQGFP